MVSTGSIFIDRFALAFLSFRKAVSVLAFALLVGALFGVPRIQAAVSEAEAKAELVFRIVQFIDWEIRPADESFVIGVFADSEFEEVLKKSLDGRMIEGRKFSVKVMEESSELAKARVVVALGANRRRISRFFDFGISPAVLTLGDSEAFLKAGGMISMLRSRAGKIRLSARSELLKGSGLKVSSKLMRILTR